MISFGVGFSAAIKMCLKINGWTFAGGTVNGECLAIPWCRGGYALFSKDNSFDEADKSNTVLSVGGNNLSVVAAAFAGLEGAAEEESTSAYVRFLNGKYKYLLGTQRDICRFASRGASVYIKPLSTFCDLYQYIAVLATEEEDKNVCNGFIASLLSEETQKKLTEIGMMSAFYDVYSADNSLADDLEKESVRYTLSAFTSVDGLNEVKKAARAADGEKTVLKNFLKVI
jgi:hypothetical protein